MNDSPWDSLDPTDTSEPVVEKPRKSGLWKFLAWAGIAFGIIALTNVVTEAQSTKEVIGTCLGAAALIVPALLWFRYEKLDAKAYEEAAENARTYQFLTPEDRALLGGDPSTKPKLVKRRWGIVAFLALLTFSFGGTLLPDEETNNEHPAANADSKPTGNSEATTVTKTIHKTTTASSESTSSQANVPVDHPSNEAGISSLYASQEETYVTEQMPAYESPVPSSTFEEATVEPAPAPAVVPAPVQEPASAPSSGGTSYYANCSEARAAGAAPLYVGEAGYRSGLDRDGDGIACE